MKVGDIYLHQIQHIAKIGTIQEIGKNYLVLTDVEVYDLRELIVGIVRPVKGESPLTIYLDKKLTQQSEKKLKE